MECPKIRASPATAKASGSSKGATNVVFFTAPVYYLPRRSARRERSSAAVLASAICPQEALVIVALAQIDAVVGDFDGNRARIVRLATEARARESGVSLVVFPETALCGYPPMDLLDQESFVEGSLAALRALQKELPPGLAVALGYVDRNRTGSGKPLVNAIAVILDGAIVFTQEKTLLPTYDVFDEARYFEPARERHLFRREGRRVGFAICEDIWWEEPPVPGIRYPVDPVRDLLNQGADLIVVPSASPFHAGKLETRLRLSSGLPGKRPCRSCTATWRAPRIP
jgi:NAD+ synthase (glutamine-hydrolysing)